MGTRRTLSSVSGLTGVCQYRRETLPIDSVRTALYAHEALHINQTLSLINPHYGAPELLIDQQLEVSDAQVRRMLNQLGEPIES